MDVARRLEVVERELDELRWRVAQLEEALMGTLPLPLEWGLTAAEARVFGGRSPSSCRSATPDRSSI